jgi:hypothetical protein
MATSPGAAGTSATSGRTRTADILIASAPGLWAGAVAHGYLQPFTPAGISNYPSFTSQGNGLYVFSPDPAITIYNKIKLNGQAPPATVAQAAQDGISGKYKVATYTINNSFGCSAFYGYAHQKGWAALDKLGQTAQTPGDGDVLAQDVAQGGFTVAVFESGLARGPIETVPADKKLLGWEYTKGLHAADPPGYRDHRRCGQPRLGQAVHELRVQQPGPAGVPSVSTAPAAPDMVTIERPAGNAPAEGARVRRLVPETGLQAAIWALVLVGVLAPVLPLVYAVPCRSCTVTSARSFPGPAVTVRIPPAACRVLGGGARPPDSADRGLREPDPADRRQLRDGRHRRRRRLGG